MLEKKNRNREKKAFSGCGLAERENWCKKKNDTCPAKKVRNKQTKDIKSID